MRIIIPRPTAIKRQLAPLGKRSRFVAALALIICVALSLRIYGIGWDKGYDWTPHPDERAILMKAHELSLPSWESTGQLISAEESPWNPKWFNYGSLPLYLVNVAQHTTGLLPVQQPDVRITGRTISALADVGTVILISLLGAIAYGRREGIIAAAFLAVAVLHIQLSHFYAVDTQLTLFAIAAIYFMCRVAKGGKYSDSIYAGVFIGLGLATKASLAPIGIAFVMAHLLATIGRAGEIKGGIPGLKRESIRGLYGLVLGGGVALGALVIAQPYAFLDWGRFLADFNEQSEMVRRIRDYPYTRQYIDTTPYWYHVRHLSAWGLGWPMGVVVWAGIFYAALSGMKLKNGLLYIGFGVAVPMALLIISHSIATIIIASGIAFVALAATIPFRTSRARTDVLLLSWVVPYFMITGALEVKFLRYLLPITPILLLWGSRMLCVLWDRADGHRTRLRPIIVGAGVALIAVTGLYALSYTAVYKQPHTGVRTSAWINSNIDQGAVVLMEHWEEALPDMGSYQVSRMPLYNDDTSGKAHEISNALAKGDVLVFFSNRLYGTIPRLPERYPVTSEYYRLLFSGRLGYELVHIESAYPRLAGISLVDDTLNRPGLSAPASLQAHQQEGLAMNLGFADESFTVYDHPLGLVFKNVERLDAGTIRKALEARVASTAEDLLYSDEMQKGLMMSLQDVEKQRQGGTWTSIIKADSWTNRFPVLAWLLLIEIVSLLALPVTFVLFRPLPDKGVLFSKPLGLLALAGIPWMLASLGWVEFSRTAIAIAMVLMAIVSGLVLIRNRQELFSFVRVHKKTILVGEAVFLLAFLSFLMIRMANPDLWHPWRGGEKPMELAYLNAVIKSSYMPPFDPWFSGGYLNYYYFGQFMVATLIRVTGIATTVAFNLAIPMFFAFTVSGAYTILYNLVAATPGRLKEACRQPAERFVWPPVAVGVGGGLLVAVLGNLDGAIQVAQGAWSILTADGNFAGFDYWRSSRMMPPDPPGHEITEFPFFTFLFADLHPHLMSIPFTLLALGLSLALVLGARSRARASCIPRATRLKTFMGRGIGKLAEETAQLGALGIVVGALFVINAWDFPTYLILAVGSVFLAEYLRSGGLDSAMVLKAGMKGAFVCFVSYVAFLPFHLASEVFFSGLESTTNKTTIWQFLSIFGLFIFIISSYFLADMKYSIRCLGRGLGVANHGTARIWVGLAMLVTLAITLLAAGNISGVLGGTITLLLVLEAMVLVALFRFMSVSKNDAPQLSFVAAIVAVALGLAAGLELYRVEGDIDRMNSIFKFYLQVWVLLALGSTYLLWHMIARRKAPFRSIRWANFVWAGCLVALIVASSIYTVMGTKERLRDRFNAEDMSFTLDGSAYIDRAVYNDPTGREIDLAADFVGIRWLQEHVQGSPVVLEANTPTYRWGGRVSIYTGLPSVVGWKWHQEQQRWGYREAVTERINDVNQIYSTDSISEALSLMRKYGVEYIYIGQVEKIYYPEEGIKKFDNMTGAFVDEVYTDSHVRIYRVRNEEMP